MKYLPIDVSSFSRMIQENYLYVDKTEYIYNLFKGGNRYYFLSRPRRFGKSLLISTLKELFSGNKELFKNLWIYTSDYQWQEYPVIHLDFSVIDHGNVQELKENLILELKTLAQQHAIDISQAPSLGSMLKMLVVALSKKNKVVILIDEYDKPILDHIHDSTKAHEIREVLHSFYGTMKGLDEYLRAIFLTGVSRFSKTSIFSGLNNLNDISLNEDAAMLLGYTQQELHTYFMPHIEALAQHLNISVITCQEQLQYWYNGYRFSDLESKVYNPFSMLYCLQRKKMLNYWFTSGTPTFLIHLIKKQYLTLEELGTLHISDEGLAQFSIEKIPLVPLLFQTGYLTIAAYQPTEHTFTLDFPNFEVKSSFFKFLVAALTHTEINTVDTAITRIRSALRQNDIKHFCSILQHLFAHIPYTIAREDYYHTSLHFLLNLLSLDVSSEVLTNTGRIDMTLNTPDRIFLFELKYNASPEIALEQIKKKKYYERYLGIRKPITLIGLAFNSADGTIQLEYITEELG